MAITSTAATGQYTALPTSLNSTTSATVNTANQSKSDPTYSELQPSGKPLPLITALTNIDDVNPPLDDNPLNSFTLDSIAEQERIKQIEQVLQQVNRSLQFHVDDDSGEHIATIVDKTSGEVIRQVPAQELLELNKNLAKHALGSISKTV
ncbi:flagellar protein FlaG [Photobacterium piscicola]|uniref:flagellar protein FlaG n=1 Tax=Photobacterium piscicola TaxID=1378299 RepID=UPI002E17A54F|nr:flagellar protein FlaG [Photobacterium piscicola]